MNASLKVLFACDDLSRWSTTIAGLGQDLQNAGRRLARNVHLHQEGGWPNCDFQAGGTELVIVCVDRGAALQAMLEEENPLDLPFMVLLSKGATLDDIPPRTAWSKHLFGVRRLPVHGIEALEMLNQYLYRRLYQSGLRPTMQL